MYSNSHAYQKFISVLQSRKFWALIASLGTIWTAVYVGAMSTPDAINATIAALSVYSVGVAAEGIGKGN